MKRRSKMLTDIPQINQALEFIKAEDDNTTQETLRMCQIAAPSFHEEKKAEYVCKRFEQIGLSDVHIDEVGNAWNLAWNRKRSDNHACGTYGYCSFRLIRM